MTPKNFQKTLRDAGFDPGVIDGLWGPNTEEATERWFDDGMDIPVVESPEDPEEPSDSQIMSNQGQEFLIGWEGEELTAYKDVSGVWTIGCGHTSAAGPPNVYQGMTITKQESREILASDLYKFEERVAREFGYLPQAVFDGAVSFDYNTGAIDSASWPDYWKKGDFEMAEKKLKEWIKAGGEVVEGLVKRRDAEADMIFRNDYSGRP